jgi:hypothetical protein
MSPWFNGRTTVFETVSCRFESYWGYQAAPKGAIFICAFGEIMEDEKPLDLRDKLALEIINALILGDPSYHKVKDPSSPYTVEDHIGTAKKLVNNYNHNAYKGDAIEQMEKIARTAYKMADVMRKIRLEVFA